MRLTTNDDVRRVAICSILIFAVTAGLCGILWAVSAHPSPGPHHCIWQAEQPTWRCAVELPRP